MSNIQDIKLVDLLPLNIAQDPKIKAAAEAIDKEILAVTQAIKMCLVQINIDDLPEKGLDMLAWELHVDFYEPDLPIETKRVLVKNSIPWHQRKGTPSVMEELLSAIFSPTIVEEWWEYNGEPYHFRVFIGIKEGTSLEYDKIISSIDKVKNKRSVLDDLIPLFTSTLSINISFNRWLSDILRRCGTINTIEAEIIATFGRRYGCFLSEIKQRWFSELLPRASQATFMMGNGLTYNRVLTDSKTSFFSIVLPRASETTYCGLEVYA
jgi:phage tail P2-like protein